MKSYIIAAALLVCSVPATVCAQEPGSPVRSGTSYTIPGSAAIGFRPAEAAAPTPHAYGTPTASRLSPPDVSVRSHATPTDTLYVGPAGRLPDERPHNVYPAPYTLFPAYGYLHPGFNASLDLSAFAFFGKNVPGGAGFTQRLSVSYLRPLSERLWLAVGGYVGHTVWNGNHYTAGGLYGELGYRLNDQWSAYVYGRKSLINSGGYGSLYGLSGSRYGMLAPGLYHPLGDKLGAAVRWTPNPTVSVELSVEQQWLPNGALAYPDRYRYNYPVPKP